MAEKSAGIPHFEELSPKEAGIFRDKIRAAKSSQGANGRSVDVHKVSDYKGMRTFLTRDGSAGYAVTPAGELTSVFKHKDSPHGNIAQYAAEHAQVVGGATHLSAFDPELPKRYTAGGFTAVAHVPFNPDYKPAGWDMEKQGKPDVVFMAAKGKLGEEPKYSQGQGASVDNYDAGMGAADVMARLNKRQFFKKGQL
ncbi:hypothetical protein UFOVP45_84 [uncultured Caudovirales phage]|uniref:Uncharacterized protein n=1 Tax=uncultured Caudovirales phage TaxID=2100421 RepID=A0A6J5KS54_9CAUD|nr:hypothetical protein UFOVP45_84 [uncultured Caudovirales phage]